MPVPQNEQLTQTIAQLAPGTALRDGLERILRGRTGALIVLGNDRTVEAIGTGGFEIDIEFTGTRLRELAKMDGAIICDRDASRILRAGIHLMPDPTIPAVESGTRHRTAERVARQTGFPVVSVSASMNTITIYQDGDRYVLEGSQAIMARADQAIQTLERYTERLDQEFQNLSALEIESNVTVRNVAATLQRLELVRRITEEIAAAVVELGEDGRMIAMQLEELVIHQPAPDTVLLDYLSPVPDEAALAAAGRSLAQLAPLDLADLATVAAAVGLPGDGNLEQPLSPRGHRLLAGIRSIPRAVADRLVASFDGLQALMAASPEELKEVDGVGELRARTIRESLARMAEASLLERFM